jgi:AcrR family transcriptional regulator
MTSQPRTLRAIVQASPYPVPPRSALRQARYNRILGAAAVLFDTVGRENITMANLALALDIAPTTLRREIVDIDFLFAEILRPHLHAITEALAEIPATAPNAIQLRRAAYIAHTRTKQGTHLIAHRLLMNQGHHLPPDLHAPIMQAYCAITGQLAEANRMVETLTLLENLDLSAEDIEARLAAAPKPAPAPPPNQAAPAPPKPANLPALAAAPPYARTG